MNNKSVFAKNLQLYMDLNQKTRRDMCRDLGFSYYTFSDWVNGKKYPRMDKVEILANYFGIQKSDLIEDKEKEEKNIKNSDAMAGITVKMFEDEDFFLVVKFLSELDEKQFKRVKVSLHNLFEERFNVDVD